MQHNDLRDNGFGATGAPPTANSWRIPLLAAIAKGLDAQRMLAIYDNQDRRTFDEQDELDALERKHPDLVTP